MLRVMYFFPLLRYIGLDWTADDRGKASSRQFCNNGREKLNFTMTTHAAQRHPIRSAIRSADTASRWIGFGNPRRLMRQKTDSTLSRRGARPDREPHRVVGASPTDQFDGRRRRSRRQ